MLAVAESQFALAVVVIDVDDRNNGGVDRLLIRNHR